MNHAWKNDPDFILNVTRRVLGHYLQQRLAVASAFDPVLFYASVVGEIKKGMRDLDEQTIEKICTYETFNGAHAFYWPETNRDVPFLNKTGVRHVRGWLLGTVCFLASPPREVAQDVIACVARDMIQQEQILADFHEEYRSAYFAARW